MRKFAVGLAFVGATTAMGWACGGKYGEVTDEADGGVEAAPSTTATPTVPSGGGGEEAGPPASEDAATEPPDAGQDAGPGCTCAAKAPVGWDGPFVRSIGAPPADCAAPFEAPQLVGTNVASVPNASCTPCTCGTGSPACLVSEIVYNNNACGVSCGAAAQNEAPGRCIPVPAIRTDFQCDFGHSWAFAFFVDGPAGPDYSCAPSGGVSTRETVTPSVVRLCGQSTITPANACSPSDVCLPTPASAFAGRFCIAQQWSGPSDDLACPSGTPYTERTVTYDTLTDGRGCSACSCAQDRPELCSDPTYAPIVEYDDLGCTTPSADSIVAPQCTIARSTNHGARYMPNAAAATCTPSGGAVTGGVTFDHRTTICCTK